MTIFGNEYVINSSEPMNCGERLFKISLEADVEPGDYRIQVSLIHPDTILSWILFTTKFFHTQYKSKISCFLSLDVNIWIL